MASKKTAINWCESVMTCDLRSRQLAAKMVRLTSGLVRSQAKWVLAVRVAAHCGSLWGAEQYRRHLREKMAEAQRAITAIPNLDEVEFGRGQDIGKWVPKPRALPPGPVVVPAGYNANGLANRMAGPVQPFVDFPLDHEIQEEHEVHDVPDDEDLNETVDLTSDSEDEMEQSTLSESKQ